MAAVPVKGDCWTQETDNQYCTSEDLNLTHQAIMRPAYLDIWMKDLHTWGQE